MPMERCSFEHPTTFACSRMPSPSSTIATVCGTPPKNAGCCGRCTTVNAGTVRCPRRGVHAVPSSRHRGHREPGGHRTCRTRRPAAPPAALRAPRPCTPDPGQRLVDLEHHPPSRRPRPGAAATLRRQSARCRLRSSGRSSCRRCPHESPIISRACGTARRIRGLRARGAHQRPRRAHQPRSSTSTVTRRGDRAARDGVSARTATAHRPRRCAQSGAWLAEHGRLTLKMHPPPGLLRAPTVPPCASTACFTMASPRPKPLRSWLRWT